VAKLLAQLSEINLVDWFAMVTGIAGVYLSIKEKVSAWPLFILCYAAYVYISFRGSYYAFGGMNILFVGLAAYGWLKWSTSTVENGDSDIKISHLAAKHRLSVALSICIGTLSIGYLLSATGEARLPYYDAFATSCALVAQWMLGRKHVENWFFWIAADSVWLFFFFNDRIWPSVILFSMFIFLAIKGWMEWTTTIKKTAT
jgi:nicotinamide mononucleotide transporter